MTQPTQIEIDKLAQECAVLETQLAEKKTALQATIMAKLTAEGAEHPMHSFVGKPFIHDRPHKWQDPRNSVFTEESLKRFSYLEFNGIMTGAAVNAGYFEEQFNPDDKFYAFVVPDEACDYPDVKPLQMVDVYEIVLFPLA